MKSILTFVLSWLILAGVVTSSLAQTKDTVFKGASLLTIQNGQPRKQKIRLRLTDNALVLESKDGKQVVHELPYADLRKVEYLPVAKSRDVEGKVIGGGLFLGGVVLGQGAAERHPAVVWLALGMTFAGVGFFTSGLPDKDLHWLYMKTDSQVYEVQLSGRNHMSLIKMLELRGNITVL